MLDDISLNDRLQVLKCITQLKDVEVLVINNESEGSTEQS